jgi:hypothetical protein
MPAKLSRQAAEDHDRQRRQQSDRQPFLCPWLAPANHRRQKDTGGEEGSGHPEDRQLQMPGTGEVKRKNLG